MGLVFQDFKEVLISRNTATVLGWAIPFTIQTNRILTTRLAFRNLFDFDDVIPAISKIIRVGESHSGLGDQSVDGYYVRVCKVFGGIAVNVANHIVANPEIKQVRILPAHCDLNDVMQVEESNGIWHEQSPPDRYEVSEPIYFKYFETSLIKVNPVDSQKSKIENVFKAISHCISEDLMETVDGLPILKKDETQVWCVFDRDTEEVGAAQALGNISFNEAIEKERDKSSLE